MQTFSGPFVFLCYAVALLYWIVAAFWAKRTIQRQGWWGSWLARTAAAVFVALLILRRRTGPMPASSHLWQYSPAIGAIASVVTATGLIILLWGRAALAGNWSVNVVLKENHELIERGPYRYVRHPIYTGFILMAIGGVMLWGTSTGLAALVGLPVSLWIKLSEEERLLTQHFPDAYPRYKGAGEGSYPVPNRVRPPENGEQTLSSGRQVLCIALIASPV
jgi:protein-S-isoprenylcysteine O-methyltransferase Ste14